MRKSLSMLALVGVALLTPLPEASARGRRGFRPCGPPCCVTYYQCYPYALWDPVSWQSGPCVSSAQTPASTQAAPPRISWSLASRYDQSGVTARVIPTSKGRTYRAIATTETDLFQHAPPSIPPAMAEAVRAAPGDTYIGHDRKAAKLSVGTGDPEEPPVSVQNLLTTLRADDEMRKYQPPITKAEDSQRVTEEQRNVTVDGYLYAAKKEPNDNDFHLILGGDTSQADGPFMNAEISGLPTGSPSLAQLATARAQFKKLINLTGGPLPGIGQYERFDPPIPVRVSGSLLYDIDHLPGVVGPIYAKPDTSWEIHPITSIDER